MLSARVIPCLLLKNGGLVKTVKFKNPGYIGDPINTVRIFNEKEVDELCFLDIEATKQKREPDYKMLKKIADECFMPLSYGGGITKVEQIGKILNIGLEKVVINSASVNDRNLIPNSAAIFGSQSIVASIDVKRSFFGKYEVVIQNAGKSTGLNPVEWAKAVQEMGAGEILLTSVDKEGTWEGYDIGLIKSIVDAVSIPVIANGGAGNIAHLSDCFHEGNASALAVGSMVVYQKKGYGVLINYPQRNVLTEIFKKR